MVFPVPGERDDLDDLERQFHAGEAVVRPGEAGAAAAAGSRAPGAPVPEGAAAERATAAPGAAPSGTAAAAGAGEDFTDDDLRGTVLARKLARRRGYGLVAREPRVRRGLSTWALAAIAALSAWSFSGVLPDLRYWLSSGAPRDLGHLGAYAPLDAIPDGTFVRIEGIASPRRGSYSRFLRDHEVFPLIGSRILVDRPHAPDDSLRGYGFRYKGDGRLSRAGSHYEGVREQFAQAGELSRTGELWVLEDGASPHRGLRTPLEALFWAGLGTLAALSALRRIAAARSK